MLRCGSTESTRVLSPETTCPLRIQVHFFSLTQPVITNLRISLRLLEKNVPTPPVQTILNSAKGHPLQQTVQLIPRKTYLVRLHLLMRRERLRVPIIIFVIIIVIIILIRLSFFTHAPSPVLNASVENKASLQTEGFQSDLADCPPKNRYCRHYA